MKPSDLRNAWHRVPPDMRGTQLLPLKELARTQPDVAAGYSAKYTGREHIAQLDVPLLDCKWDELIFLSPIHPHKVSGALKDAGIEPRQSNTYEIPVEALKGHEAVWFDPTKAGKNGELTPESVWPVDWDEYRAQPLSDKARPYYERCAAQGRSPLLLGTELHLLIRGYTRDGKPDPIDISRAQIIPSAASAQGAAR